MRNFEFYCPTKLIFGKDSLAGLNKLIDKKERILITFGGGSAKRNGVYDQVIKALEGYDYSEFWGIEANPTVETVREAVAQGKEYKATFILAVGGGSVIDATKLIAAGIVSDKDPWDIVRSHYAEKVMPFGSVLTVPATGSEMNSGAVISCKKTKEKFAFSSRHPKFSVLDPEVTYSLSDHQIACGLADTFVHVMEQYLTVKDESMIMDRFAEGVLMTVMEIVPKIRQDKTNYDLMSNYMISATMGLNGFLSWGITEDWATHSIGHELTALAGLTHGASLVIVLPALMRIMKDQKGPKILQYAERVLNIKEGSDNEKIDKAIQMTEEFFQSLGLPTRLSDAQVPQNIDNEIVKRFADRRWKIGEARNIDSSKVEAILKLCRPSYNNR